MKINSTLHISQNDLKANGAVMKNNSSKTTHVQLSDKEKIQVERLKKEDERVRTHESAHKSAAGSLANGAPNYKFKLGPDGKRYAIGGHVKIDISEVANNPEATIRKAQQIKTAALAPAEPSAQDQKVAVQASRMEAKARQELSKTNNVNK